MKCPHINQSCKFDKWSDICNMCSRISPAEYAKIRLRKYLEWRFRMNNHSKYLKYMNDWIDNTLPNQLEYFMRERNNLISNDIYHE